MRGERFTPPLLMEKLVYSGRREWGDLRVNKVERIKTARVSGRLHTLYACGTGISIYGKEVGGGVAAG